MAFLPTAAAGAQYPHRSQTKQGTISRVELIDPFSFVEALRTRCLGYTDYKHTELVGGLPTASPTKPTKAVRN